MIDRPPESTTTPSSTPLGMWDTLSIIVGIVVGTAIFRSPPLVFQNCGSPLSGILVWCAGGILSLIGALCYAELATSYPRAGGDYSFLRVAFGPWLGFLFAWSQLTVVLTGSISAMSYAFADYAGGLAALSEWQKGSVASGVIVCTTAFNLMGISAGRFLQNALTLTKVLGIVCLLAAGLIAFGGRDATATVTSSSGSGNWGLALVFVLYAFGGWNDSAFVAAEVRTPERNIPRALLLGLTCVTIIYVVVNAVYLMVLGFDEAARSFTPATDVMRVVLGNKAGHIMSLMVMISAWGAIQGMIFTGARIYASAGQDHRILRRLGAWDTRRNVPTNALLAQAAMALFQIWLVGSAGGRQLIDDSLQAVNLAPIPWTDYHGGFEVLVAASAPVFWSFFLATGVAVFVLRQRPRSHPRPFSVPGYPLPPLLFCGMCAYMLYSSVVYAQLLTLFGLLPVVLGGVIHVIATALRPPSSVT